MDASRAWHRWAPVLGVVVGSLAAPGFAAAATTCTFDPVTHVVALTSDELDVTVTVQGFLPGEPLAFASPTTAGFQPCDGATTTNTDLVTISDTSPTGAQVNLYLDTASLQPGFTHEQSGVSEIEVEIAGASRLQILGNSTGAPGGARRITIGDEQAAFTQDGDADVLYPRSDNPLLTSASATLAFGRVVGLGGHGVLPATSLGITAGAPVVKGGGGADYLVISPTGQPGRALGGGGNDTMLGSSAADVLRGGPGDDAINGFPIFGAAPDGADEIFGGPGDDRLDGGAGPDVLDGGEGDDTIDARDGEVDAIDGGAGFDVAMIDCGPDPLARDTFVRVEEVSCVL
jgi:Ca2+-binding RTX toxin-like protein